MSVHRCHKDNRGAHGEGTHSCYSLCSCRCWPCVAARSDYEAARARANTQGRALMVDAEPVRCHVRELTCDGPPGSHHKGVGLKQIAKVSGVSHGALWKLIYGAPDRDGPSKRVRRATAEKLLAVTFAGMADGATVPAGPTWRRVDEMVAAGWAKVAIARHVHGPRAIALQLSRTRVTAGNARKVAALHAGWKSGRVPTEAKRSRWEVTDVA